MFKKGFTLIELLIVIAIIAILTGVAVPYYNDYIYDSRTSVLQNNLAAIRKAINQFRGDNQRGPFRVDVKGPDGNILVAAESGVSGIFEELVNGPAQYINGWRRRNNLKYLSSLPSLIEPSTGAAIAFSRFQFKKGPTAPEACTCWFYDENDDGIFDMSTESAFVDGDGNNVRDDWDVNPFNNLPWPNPVSPSDLAKVKPLDFIEIYFSPES